jgi:hypothetical protein
MDPPMVESFLDHAVRPNSPKVFWNSTHPSDCLSCPLTLLTLLITILLTVLSLLHLSGHDGQADVVSPPRRPQPRRHATNIRSVRASAHRSPWSITQHLWISSQHECSRRYSNIVLEDTYERFVCGAKSVTLTALRSKATRLRQLLPSRSIAQRQHRTPPHATGIATYA